MGSPSASLRLATVLERSRRQAASTLRKGVGRQAEGINLRHHFSFPQTTSYGARI